LPWRKSANLPAVPLAALTPDFLAASGLVETSSLRLEIVAPVFRSSTAEGGQRRLSNNQNSPAGFFVPSGTIRG
jgi:hypothetical protein